MKKINNGKSGEYGKDYTKIKFSSDDDLPLNKQLNFINVTIIVRTFFKEDEMVNIFFPFFILQKFLHNFFYNSSISICKDLQKTIILSSDPFIQIFTFTIQCICNL